MENVKKEAIKQVIEKAYIEGIHRTQEESTVRSGFHQNFVMFVRQGDMMAKVNVDEWLKRLEKMKTENPELWNTETTHHFKLIDITGDAAMAKLDVYKGATHFSTDYMLLYKFENGWEIVSKIFTIPG